MASNKTNTKDKKKLYFIRTIRPSLDFSLMRLDNKSTKKQQKGQV